jgi:hypothetical protein
VGARLSFGPGGAATLPLFSLKGVAEKFPVRFQSFMAAAIVKF